MSSISPLFVALFAVLFGVGCAKESPVQPALPGEPATKTVRGPSQLTPGAGTPDELGPSNGGSSNGSNISDDGDDLGDGDGPRKPRGR